MYDTLIAAKVPPDASVVAALVSASRHSKKQSAIITRILDDVALYNIDLDDLSIRNLATGCVEAEDLEPVKKLIGILKRYNRLSIQVTNLFSLPLLSFSLFLSFSLYFSLSLSRSLPLTTKSDFSQVGSI